MAKRNIVPAVSATTGSLMDRFTDNQVTPTADGFKPFVIFDSKRTGEWYLGTDREEVTDEEFGLDLSTITHGWFLWHQKKLDKRMVSFDEPLPEAQESIEYKEKGKTKLDEPAEARGINGEMRDGTQFAFETNSHGGRQAVDRVLTEVITRARQRNPYMFPVLKMERDSYEHSEYGTVYKPVLTVVEWLAADGEKEAVTEKLEAPKKKGGAKKTAAKKPVQRRRRSAAA